MNIGIKVKPTVTKEYLTAITNYVDFIELYADPKYDFVQLNEVKWNKPVVIHVAHFSSGTNFSSPKRQSQNTLSLEHAVKLADKFNSTKIIFHPELVENDSSLTNLINFIKTNYDKRLLVENMPMSSMGYTHYARSPEEIKYITNQLNIGFCFDVAHALEYLNYNKLKLDIEPYIKLNPDHVHITDTDLNKVFEDGYNEEHLNFGEGNITPIQYINSLPYNISLTVETPENLAKQTTELNEIRGYI